MSPQKKTTGFFRDPHQRFMLGLMAGITVIVLFLYYGLPILMTKNVSVQDTITRSDGTSLSCTVTIAFPKNTDYAPLEGYVAVSLEDGTGYQYELTGDTRQEGDFYLTDFWYLDEKSGLSARGTLCYCPDTEGIALLCEDNDILFVPEAMADAQPIASWRPNT